MQCSATWPLCDTLCLRATMADCVASFTAVAPRSVGRSRKSSSTAAQRLSARRSASFTPAEDAAALSRCAVYLRHRRCQRRETGGPHPKVSVFRNLLRASSRTSCRQRTSVAVTVVAQQVVAAPAAATVRVGATFSTGSALCGGCFPLAADGR